jgi:hypothetical protein
MLVLKRTTVLQTSIPKELAVWKEQYEIAREE